MSEPLFRSICQVVSVGHGIALDQKGNLKVKLLI